ncbi:MAG: TolC family protein [Candidatus Tumulicola sp.]
MFVKTRSLWIVVALLAVIAASLPFPNASAQSEPAAASRAVLPTNVPSPILPIVPTVAPGYGAPNVAPTSADIAGVTQQPFVGIALEDAIGMALLKNPNLAVSSANARIAGYQVVEAKGAFNMRLQVQPSSSMSVQPPTNPFFAGPGDVSEYFCHPVTAINCGVNPTAQPEFTAGPGNIIQHQYSFNYGLGGQTVNGAQYTAGIQQSRTYNNTLFNTFNVFYLATLNLAVTQPLLRNSGMNAAKRQYKLAIVNADSNSAQSLVDTSNTLSQVEDVYWSLVAAWRNVAIQEEAVKDAATQQNSVVRLAKRGAAAPIDATEAATQVATFQDNVFSALQTVSELQNQLKGLIVTSPGDPIWMANLLPTTSVAQAPAAPTLNAIVAEALKNRPEIRQAIDKYREAEIDLTFAKNQALPQADAQITYQSNGFAGLLQATPPAVVNQCPFQNAPDCPTPPPYTQGTMAQAYHNLWTFRYPTFNIGVMVSFPVGNDVAKGLKGIAHEEQQQAAVEAAGVAARIGYDARNALQSYQSALSRLHAARIAREASEQVYASETRKYHNGASTTFLVLQRQVELNQNRGRELLAQTDLNKAVVEIERVEGTILTKNNVNLQRLGSEALAGSPGPLPTPSGRLPTPFPVATR